MRELYERELAQRLASGPPVVQPTEATEEFLEAMCVRLRARGWEPILMTQPLILGDDPLAQYAHLWRPEKDPPPVIDLTDPARYPELFSSGIHFDRQHLNHRGARRMSEILAERLVAALAERGRCARRARRGRPRASNRRADAVHRAALPALPARRARGLLGAALAARAQARAARRELNLLCGLGLALPLADLDLDGTRLHRRARARAGGAA